MLSIRLSLNASRTGKKSRLLLTAPSVELGRLSSSPVAIAGRVQSINSRQSKRRIGISHIKRAAMITEWLGGCWYAGVNYVDVSRWKGEHQ